MKNLKDKQINFDEMLDKLLSTCTGEQRMQINADLDNIVFSTIQENEAINLEEYDKDEYDFSDYITEEWWQEVLDKM